MVVESREHVSARVLSTTTEEDQGKKENPIKLVTDKQGNEGSTMEKADGGGENVDGEDAIDVGDNDAKLTKSAHASDQESQIKVVIFFPHYFYVLFFAHFVSVAAACSQKR